MLKQTFLNKYRGWGIKPPQDALVIHVTRSNRHMLSPSYELLMEYKSKKISWAQYVSRFKKEMDNDACRDMMRRIKERSKEIDVYLVCVCFNKENKCHRFLLMDMINKTE